MMLSVPRLHSINDGKINECGAVGGMRIARMTQYTRTICAAVSVGELNFLVPPPSPL
jgi:hypothetical protein